MMHHQVLALQKLGYTSLTATWIGDDNPGSLAQVKLLKMERKHRVAVYEKQL